MNLRDTPTTYSADEAATIRRNFQDGREDLICPRCRTPLLFGPVLERRGRLLGDIYCQDCHRCVMVTVGTETNAASGSRSHSFY